MKPLDPRLIRRSRAARRFLATGAVLAVVQTAAVVAFAWSLAALVAGLVAGDATTAARDAAVVAASVVMRALAAWGWDVVGSAGAQAVKREFRADLLAALERRPEGVPEFPSARIATLLGPGLDALDEYFGRYLPQLLLAVLATPVLIVAAWTADWLSGLTLVIVLPLIPLFMALIGLATQAVQRRQWQSLEALSRAFLEVLGGLSTLMVFGRERRQVARIRATTDDYRVRTIRVLRVTFLSGFTLELAASLSVALVAVSIGLRLVDGGLTLAIGLFVLVLAPEVLLPLRNVGAAFHSAAAGVTASGDALDLMAAAGGPATGAASAGGSPVAPRGGLEPRVAVEPHSGLALRGVDVRRGDATVARGVDLDVARGEVVALTGPSGSGKSSVIAAILGFADADGDLIVDGLDGAGHAAVAWSSQSATLIAGTVADNVRLGDPDAPPELVATALRLAAVDDLAPETAVGPENGGLSGGQAQRVAVARAIHRLLARDLGVLLLDEPSSALDEAREASLARGLRELAADGRAILVATHRMPLAEAADRIVPMGVPSRA
ncbi:thiol reductant ABC exporter subunit CydD [Agromyces sp. CFH 90414]|uniref:Thiol reductant ABC exporter subunit CydD n=1 Tax=Agromyces agglutinans TaxID=2662258 RepID=A0A6I2FLP2_9MICO|nr:thiol reductant ABC exporter subunit CydD [Agromyces agglutinans]MRG61548.1 thiol reductant ABC exporter subunit CydD [Agromyces agglutinans]